MSDTCKKCAECCKHYPLVDLSENEIRSLEKETGKDPDLFTNKKGRSVEEYFLQFKKNGECCFLVEGNGVFSCSVYDARPEICRNYPSRLIQKDVCEAKRKIFMEISGAAGLR
nr:YkgJ family cysteine cluster protein [Desulfobulbaceae bacterium]